MASGRADAMAGTWTSSALRADSIEGDLRARDFTVNAIGMPLAGGDPIDPTGGVADAEARVLRAASEAAFEDDPLRLLRAAGSRPAWA